MNRLKSLHGKPWHQVAAFGVVAGLLYLCFWNYVTSPVKAETAALEEQVTSLKQENEKARIASQRINEFRAAYQRAQVDYEELKALLPEQRELTTVLAGLQDRAFGRLSVRRFTPKEDVKQDFYSGKPIEVEITGAYNNLGAFFADMAQYQRIVSISDFKVDRNALQSGGRTVDAQFLLTAYYVSAESLQQQTAPKTPAGTAPAAAAAATPATTAATSSTGTAAPAAAAMPATVMP